METVEKDLAQQINRLNNLRDNIICLFSKELDYDGDRNFIITDALFQHLVNGDLNDFFESPLLDEMDDIEKNKVLNTINKYSNVLFYNNNSSYWFDSVDMALIDYDVIALKLLDYYDFLISIYLKGGEQALRELKKYVDFDAMNETSIVDFLMRTFKSREALEKVIIDMSREDGPYKGFSTDQRACLLKYPEGTLYYNDDNNITYVNPTDLIKKISKKEGDFENIISEISYDYLLLGSDKKLL